MESKTIQKQQISPPAAPPVLTKKKGPHSHRVPRPAGLPPFLRPPDKKGPPFKILKGPHEAKYVLDQWDTVQFKRYGEVKTPYAWQFLTKDEYSNYGSPVERLKKLVGPCQASQTGNWVCEQKIIHEELQSDVQDAQALWDLKN